MSTVSLAVNLPAKVAGPTRERVMAVARRLGWVPHPAAAVLRSGCGDPSALTRKLNLAFVTVEDRPVLKSKDAMYEGPARVRAAELGYGLLRYDLGPLAAPGNLARVFRARNVAGVIFGPVHRPELLDAAVWSTLSLVRCGGYLAPTGVACVHHDAFEQMAAAWRLLWERGYRRIGVVMAVHRPRIPDDDGRLGAVLAMEAIHGAKPVPPLVAWGGEAVDVVTWFRRHRPDAVLDFARLSYFPLSDAGIVAPRDYGFLRLTVASATEDFLTGLVDDRLAVGAAAVDLVDQLIRHRRTGFDPRPRVVNVPCEWIGGETVRSG